MSHGTIIGDDHKTCGILIQATCGEQLAATIFFRYQFQYRSLRLILSSGHIALGLVQHQIHVSLEHQLRTVHHDAYSIGIHLFTGGADGHSIHQHAAAGD